MTMIPFSKIFTRKGGAEKYFYDKISEHDSASATGGITQAQLDTILKDYAKSADVYTKTQVDTELAKKQDKSS